MYGNTNVLQNLMEKMEGRLVEGGVRNLGCPDKIGSTVSELF